MTAGGGPLAQHAEELVERLSAVGVVLVVVGPFGQPRDAHELAFTDQAQLRRVPEVLRRLATDIERDLARIVSTEGHG